MIAAALAVVLFLVLANAFFVASEFAIVKIRPSRLEELAAQGNRRARVALSISRRLDEYLSANQLGITLASLALGWVGDRAFVWAGAIAGFAIITFLHTVVGELAPKSLAIQRTEPTALWTAMPLRAFYVIAFPVIWFLNTAATLTLRLFRLQRARDVEPMHSPEEMRLVLRGAALEPSTRKLIDRVFDYTRHEARHVMTLRADTAVLDVTRSFDENLKVVLAQEYSRYPLYEPVRDRVLGYVHVKDVLNAVAQGARPDLRQLVRQPIYCFEDAPLEEIRREIQRRGIHLVVVLDQQGNFAGILTLEDLVEEFVGEIRDEQDQNEVPPLASTEGGGAFEADGRLTLDVLKREIGLDLTEEAAHVETLGGYVMSQLGKVPRVGDIIESGGYRLRVVAMHGRRVLRVRGERSAPRH